MSNTPLNWHFPRTDLAESILDRFEIGATTALTLFAPRRMGKTEFVNQDLLPMAVEQGYIDVYVNFWDRKHNPADSLIAGLRKGISRLKRSAKIKQSLGKIRGMGISTPVGGANVAIEKSGEAEKLDIIQDLFDQLLKDGRRVLLALDEVQHLATEPRFEPIVYALRGLIDQNRDKMRVLYTGSSRSGLQQLFKRRNAPMFSSSQQIVLPEFGRGYLEHMANVFHAATGRTLDVNASSQAFKLVKKVPYDFRQIIDQLIVTGGVDIVAIATSYLLDNSHEDAYQSDWDGLKPVDQAVLKFIITGVGGMYTAEGRSYIANWLGLEDIDVPTIQNAVNRLRRSSHIAPIGQGRYELEDPYFLDWIVRTGD
ncbi:hypothetical protein QAO71_17985 (plasmid) [Halopseudomonas sp. SMJS2]|uniref:hypothetical protein n=1 Tax=Halopseudomonas sp. SMJS2 TaxID=3041098 RepID=UPI002452B4F9|nr:hypothetical protein [Halopseudomonas sp. SMJS2]WGK63432.1 hypothetical protein QAO71_17985 [Halopseudomonas sp. SMJS2]